MTDENSDLGLKNSDTSKENSDTNSIVNNDITENSDTNSSIDHMISHMNPTPPAHRAVGLLNSYGVPSFSPDVAIKIMMPKVTDADLSKRTKIFKKYCESVKQQIIKGLLLAKQSQLDDQLIPVSFSQLRKDCGRYGPNRNQSYWFDFFQTHSPLLIKVKEGYSIGKQRKLTMVKTTIDIEILLAGQEPESIYQSLYGDLDPNTEIDLCPIDQVSLNNYILANKAISKRTATLDENLKLAKTILLISQAPQCQGYLPQIVSESDFGRRYYRGINLQSAAKIVRLAALGECHQYDIEASVFTWKLDFVKSLYEIKLPATLDYLEFKNHHRTRLSQLLFDSKDRGYVNYIKQAITAIGFGARKTNSVWVNEQGRWQTTALRDIIKSAGHLEKFLDDHWVKEFIQEQEAMNKLIWDEIKDMPMIVDDTNLRNTNGQISKSRAIAKAYQITERQLLKKLTAIAADHQVLLTCHDGFYTKRKAKLAELRECLKEIFPNGQLDYEHHERYYYYDHTEEQLHRQLIDQQESQAQQLHPDNYRRGNDEFTKLKRRYNHRMYDEQADYFDGSYTEEQALFAPMYYTDEEEL